MPENPTRPSATTDSALTPEVAGQPACSPTLADEFLQSACTLARGRMSWTPGPGHDTEVLPWLKGATAA